jgi:phosphoketolase
MIDAFKEWSEGLGVIEHSDITKTRVLALIQKLDSEGTCPAEKSLAMFKAADVICNMGLWLTAHMTYAKNVYLDGRELSKNDFKYNPEGHTGGALNIVPAYVGYILVNALTSKTRAWMMGQGHCVAGIDSINVLLGNLEVEQAEKYSLDSGGLTALCQDFYSYKVAGDGRPESPLGSHVSPYTAGGIREGGYLGFSELQYIHMPLPGQELVTFLSDGTFEEQRGSDWAPRWWRGEDTGIVTPIMIANGRRIDQRTTLAQIGGTHWFEKHLALNGFKTEVIDGRDPAAFAY